mmetsp:Transcript_2195/g.4443  ORF Transcript_2195/g.4443 Transcript_2195/m.4443 type:complete len:242 (+) Transcript_2195:1688-2413(+)
MLLSKVNLADGKLFLSILQLLSQCSGARLKVLVQLQGLLFRSGEHCLESFPLIQSIRLLGGQRLHLFLVGPDLVVKPAMGCANFCAVVVMFLQMLCELVLQSLHLRFMAVPRRRQLADQHIRLALPLRYVFSRFGEFFVDPAEVLPRFFAKHLRLAQLLRRPRRRHPLSCKFSSDASLDGLQLMHLLPPSLQLLLKSVAQRASALQPAAHLRTLVLRTLAVPSTSLLHAHQFTASRFQLLV